MSSQQHVGLLLRWRTFSGYGLYQWLRTICLTVIIVLGVSIHLFCFVYAVGVEIVSLTVVK